MTGEGPPTPAMRKPTSFDIAQIAGVSQPTVSRALRGSPTVSAATRARIEAVAASLNYAVDKNASNLRTQRTRTLALLLFEDPSPDTSQINPFFFAMLASITRACAAHGYDLLVSFQQLSSDWHVDYEDSRKADGIILLGYGDYEAHRHRLAQLVRQGTHFVRWGSPEKGQPGTALGCDNFAGARAATRHLIALGHRDIAFLGAANPRYPEFLDRYRGHVAALAEAGIAPLPELQRDAMTSAQAGHDAAAGLIAGGTRFDAVLAASDLIAIGAMRALREAGRSVPGDVAVVGFDDIAAASFVDPPLTTLAQDTRAAGALLVETLIAKLEGLEPADRVLPVELIVRASCGAATV